MTRTGSGPVARRADGKWMTPLDGELGRGANADSTRQRTRWIVALWVALAGWTAGHRTDARERRRGSPGPGRSGAQPRLRPVPGGGGAVFGRVADHRVPGHGSSRDRLPGARGRRSWSGGHRPAAPRAGALAHNAPSTKALFLVVVVAFLLPGPAWSRQSHRHPIPSGYLGGVAVRSARVWLGCCARASWLPADRLPTPGG